MTEKPTGVFVRLPLSDEQERALENRICDYEDALLDVGTPVTGGELSPIGYINEDAIGGLATGIYQSASIFREEDAEHYDTVALVRQSDAQAQIAARDAEIARLQEYYEASTEIFNVGAINASNEMFLRHKRAREALKGGAA